MTAAYQSGFNTFVPSFDASGHLVVAYSRNPQDFPLNKIVSLSPVKKSIGYYLQITAEVAARVMSADNVEFIWPDGNDAPTGEWNTESFQFQPYATYRQAFPFRIGYKSEEQADWKILAAYAAFAAQQAMTARVNRVYQKLLNTTNYASNHVATATSLGGGFLSAGTISNPYFKKALNAAAQQIQLDTNAAVGRKDLKVVMSPVVASAIAASDEMQSFMARSPFAETWLNGKTESLNAGWGLPDYYAGFQIVVDDSVKVTSRKGATRASSYIMDANTVLMMARPGELTSVAGGPSFGTCHLFMYEEMTVEQRDDPDNRRIQGRVVEDYDVQIVAPATGFVIQHALS